MTGMIQIRNVSDTLHRQIKARAALEGVSMSLFILRELEKALARPSRRELLQAIRNQAAVELDPPPAEVVRAERFSRAPGISARVELV
ncbi:MAG: hypothetical protein OXC69_08885 [Candidatus Tectomicrobia bacterium]|nr:hypothetical protein [Candidatus Tectomicrobia bacterium]